MGSMLRIDIYQPMFVGTNIWESVFIDKWVMSRNAESMDTLELTSTNDAVIKTIERTPSGALIVARGNYDQSPPASSWIQDHGIEFLGVVTGKNSNTLYVTEYMTVYDTDMAIDPMQLYPTAGKPMSQIIQAAKDTNTYFTAEPTHSKFKQLYNTVWTIPNQVGYIPLKSQPRPSVIYENGVINIYNEIAPYFASLKYRYQYRIFWKSPFPDYTIDHIGITVVNTDNEADRVTFIEHHNASDIKIESRAGGGVTGDNVVGGLSMAKGPTNAQDGKNIPVLSYSVTYGRAYTGSTKLNLKELQEYGLVDMPIRMTIQSQTGQPDMTQQQFYDLIYQYANNLFWTEPIDMSCNYNMLELKDSKAGKPNTKFMIGAPCYIISDAYHRSVNYSMEDQLPRITSIVRDSESDIAQVHAGFKQVSMIGLWAYQG